MRIVAVAGCVLRVSGKAFAADEYLAGSILVTCKVWRAGEPLRSNRPASVTSGFDVVVSDADDLPTQVSEAVLFLHRHHGDLVRLTATAGVDELVLDFGVPQRDAAVQFDRFPAALVRAAGELRMGLELSRYAVGSNGA